MKIHIVQKGDTIWEIAKKYGVDFDQVKALNPQISSPDMIMPGMKIKIPSSTKPVKQEQIPAKETKAKKETQKPIQQKPIQKIEPDDKEKMKKVEVKMPTGHSQIVPMEPNLEMPKIKEEQIQPKMEMKKETPKIKEKKQPEMPSLNVLPELELQKVPTTKPKEKKEVQHEQQQCMPVCCCWYHPMHQFSMMGHMNGCHAMSYPPHGHMMQHSQPMLPHQGHMFNNACNEQMNHANVHGQQTLNHNQHHYNHHQHMNPMQNQMSQLPLHQQNQMREDEFQQQTLGMYGRPFPTEETGHPLQTTNQELWHDAYSRESMKANNEDTFKGPTKQFPQPPIYPAHPRIDNNE